MPEKATIENLTGTARDEALKTLDGWAYESAIDSISKAFTFKNFSEAWGFMARVALIAEQQDHHPDMSNTYNKVQLRMTTHDAGGLSMRDITFAQAVDRL